MYQTDLLLKLYEIIKEHKNIKESCCVISVVGSGGKTTLIKDFALYLSDMRFRVGVAASTKMYVPDKTWSHDGTIPHLYLPSNACAIETASTIPDNRICFYADEVLADSKISGLSDSLCRYAMNLSDILLIEADGSATKPLKGWNDNEPVISKYTDITIGILPLHCINKRANTDIVHRLDCFLSITGLKTGDVIDVHALTNVIIHKKGLFYQSKGLKLLILSHISAEDDAYRISNECKSYLDYCLFDKIKDL